ncbi:hypothetical protein BYT27DRAFT_7203252 [Phlegmacium glaucopus]|nr:hypothetical protein BYT27DRAFT_7203252 [Phlegmacium glaucopus]
MPPKPSVSSPTAISMPKSPPKTRRSTRKRAQSSVDTTAEPPVKKVATGDGEGLEGKESKEKGKSKKRGKGIRPTVLKKRVPASEGKAGENIKNTGLSGLSKRVLLLLLHPLNPSKRVKQLSFPFQLNL